MNQQELDKLQINLALSVAEVNLILSVLGQRPFDQVADLILKVRSVTLQQVADASTKNEEGTAD